MVRAKFTILKCSKNEYTVHPRKLEPERKLQKVRDKHKFELNTEFLLESTQIRHFRSFKLSQKLIIRVRVKRDALYLFRKAFCRQYQMLRKNRNVRTLSRIDILEDIIVLNYLVLHFQVN